MNNTLKEKATEDKWLIHVYDNDNTWVAFERSARLLSFVMGDFINVYSILYKPGGLTIFKAEITKKDFAHLVMQANIVYDEIHYKILDFHIVPKEFEEWMKSVDYE